MRLRLRRMTSRVVSRPPLFMYVFYYNFNNLRFNKSHNTNDFSAANALIYFVLSELMQCRLFKLLLDTLRLFPPARALRRLTDPCHYDALAALLRAALLRAGGSRGTERGHTGVCDEQNTPSRQAIALQSSSRNCSPAPDLVL